MKSMKSDLHKLELPYALASHQSHNLVIESAALTGNPLGDSTTRHNYVLAPKGASRGLPLVFHLAGYFSIAQDNFRQKVLEQNFVQKIDGGVQAGIYPKAVHVFVDANTYWGGSQYINSFGCGNYQDYILNEVYPAVVDHFGASKKTCVIGGSSGGYGALSLVSTQDSPFAIAVAVAPDSLFAISLLPDLYKAAPELAKYKNITAIKNQIAQEEMQSKKSFFPFANAIAMAHCYSPARALSNDTLEFPIDLHSGVLNESLWQEWLQHDPLHFLDQRTTELKSKQIFLDVGKYDDFHLQFGTRQIAELLKTQNIAHKHKEFSGNHFGLGARKLHYLEELKQHWN